MISIANIIHDKVIKQAAREILVPLGLFQKGQSRCWIDDNGWYIIQVEFQPSAWNKGSYLNVGISFLWEKSEASNDTLSFGLGYREKGYAEFNGDETDFYRKMLEISIYAKEKVLYYRKFNELNFCKQQLEDINEKRNLLWNKWNMAMICFLIGDIAWVKKIFMKCNQLIITEADLTQHVVNSIMERRKVFSNKSSFRKLKKIESLPIILNT